jgi:enoyl-CoA hydratase/carnithine racemase
MSERVSAASETEHLQIARSGGVAVVTLNNLAEGNRLTPEALRRLERLGAELKSDEQTQAVVITGAGDAHFSTGILNPVVRAAMSKDEIVALVRLANRAFDALEAAPQIVIAAMNGVTRAGGAELALACDLRFAAAHATLAFPEAAWGGFPGAGAPFRLGSIVGRGRALELICTGREVDATEMEKIGIVQHVYAADRLQAAALDLAGRIAAAGPLAIRGAKRIMATRTEPGLAAARELSDALRQALEWSADIDEAIAAQKEGRKPRFTGR